MKCKKKRKYKIFVQPMQRILIIEVCDATGDAMKNKCLKQKKYFVL